MRRLGMMSIRLGYALLALALVGCAGGANDTTDDDSQGSSAEESFVELGLRTDTSSRTVDLDALVGGGPAKDGIPALVSPGFEDLADSDIPDDVDGVLVEISDEMRFYPYNIMVWHEVANDSIAGQPVAVTF